MTRNDTKRNNTTLSSTEMNYLCCIIYFCHFRTNVLQSSCSFIQYFDLQCLHLCCYYLLFFSFFSFFGDALVSHGFQKR